jgi:hypothetical protein
LRLTERNNGQEAEKKTTKNNPRLVSGTKALHLLLPDLVVPIDRQYTGAFLLRYSRDFEAGKEQEAFRIAFAVFQEIARTIALQDFVGTHRFHATATKVVDNALIGFVERTRADFQNLGTMERAGCLQGCSKEGRT